MRNKLLAYAVGSAAVMLLAAVTLWAQTGTLSIIGGLIDFTTAPHTAVFKTVANAGALPTTGCTVGELVMVLNATLGQQIYENSGAGGCVWTQQVTGPTAPLAGTSGTVSGALTIGVCNTATVTVTGATTSMVATTSPVTNPDPGGAGLVRWDALVSSANTVLVRECGLGIVTPTATAFNVRVIQ